MLGVSTNKVGSKEVVEQSQLWRIPNPQSENGLSMVVFCNLILVAILSQTISV